LPLGQAQKHLVPHGIALLDDAEARLVDHELQTQPPASTVFVAEGAPTEKVQS